MKKLLFAAVAFVGLVSAGPPERERSPYGDDARTGYPPCSRTVTDQCIQLYERGVARPDNLAENRGARRHRHAMTRRERHHRHDGHAPRATAGGYPPCTVGVVDECRQGRVHARRVLARRVRMAGERG
jgi:hypothetical protein